MRPDDFASALDKILPPDCHSRLWASSWLTKAITERLDEIHAAGQSVVVGNPTGTAAEYVASIRAPEGTKKYDDCSFCYDIGENPPVTIEVQFDKWGEDIRVLEVRISEAAWAKMLARKENKSAAAASYAATHDAYGRLKISEGFGPVGAKQTSGRLGIFTWQE